MARNITPKRRKIEYEALIDKAVAKAMSVRTTPKLTLNGLLRKFDKEIAKAWEQSERRIDSPSEAAKSLGDAKNKVELAEALMSLTGVPETRAMIRGDIRELTEELLIAHVGIPNDAAIRKAETALTERLSYLTKDHEFFSKPAHQLKPFAVTAEIRKAINAAFEQQHLDIKVPRETMRAIQKDLKEKALAFPVVKGVTFDTFLKEVERIAPLLPESTFAFHGAASKQELRDSRARLFHQLDKLATLYALNTGSVDVFSESVMPAQDIRRMLSFATAIFEGPVKSKIPPIKHDDRTLNIQTDRLEAMLNKRFNELAGIAGGHAGPQ